MGLPALTLGFQAGSSVLGGLGARADAKAQQKQAEINAYIGKTRAIQTDTAALLRQYTNQGYLTHLKKKVSK